MHLRVLLPSVERFAVRALPADNNRSGQRLGRKLSASGTVDGDVPRTGSRAKAHGGAMVKTSLLEVQHAHDVVGYSQLEVDETVLGSKA